MVKEKKRLRKKEKEMEERHEANEKIKTRKILKIETGEDEERGEGISCITTGRGDKLKLSGIRKRRRSRPYTRAHRLSILIACE